MIIDSLGNLPPPQALDVKLEKNLETEEPRAIEDSEKGNDSTLDNNKQNIANNQVDKDIIKSGDIERETYNAQGNMELSNSLPSLYNNPAILTTGANKNSGQGKPIILNSGQNGVVVNIISSDDIKGKPDLKEVASESLPEPPQMGEFKDKKGLEQTTDLHIGPDIRYALTSKNPDFLKRIRWGPLTVGEYREVQYKIRELENRSITSTNILSGKIIDADQLFQTSKDNSDSSKIDIKV